MSCIFALYFREVLHPLADRICSTEAWTRILYKEDKGLIFGDLNNLCLIVIKLIYKCT